LEILPESFGNLKSLQKLELHYNKLKTLPKSFGNLKSLLNLKLKYNKLKTLPESFGNLELLKHLSLHKNHLMTLPKSFGNLSSLLTVSIDRNQLRTLPESFGNLKSIRELNLRSNKIITLPKSFSNLGSLERLWLYSNQLRALPESLFKLKKLKVLSLDNNRLNTLPESFGNLESLQQLSLKYNELINLPESFGNLKFLEKLLLRANKFIVIPSSIWPLESLKTLELNGNPLEGEDRDIAKRKIKTILEFCRRKATLHVFLSHAEQDYHNETIKIKKISKFLESKDEIYSVYYSERDLQGNFEEFMRKNVPLCQILLFFATENSLKSKPCKLELQLAIDNSLQIIPILYGNLNWEDLNKIELYDKLGNIFNLSNVKGLPYLDDFQKFSNDIYEYICKLKRSKNLFDTKQARIDQFLLDFAKIFNLFTKSNKYKALVKKEFNKIEELQRKFKDNLIGELNYLRNIFHILKNT
ncbi:MAG: leucine-rich repeat domain-containing protein, partial [Promethearchaeota archaeon]